MNVKAQQAYITHRKHDIRMREEELVRTENDIRTISTKLDDLAKHLVETKDMLEVEQVALTAYKHMNGIEDEEVVEPVPSTFAINGRKYNVAEHHHYMAYEEIVELVGKTGTPTVVVDYTRATPHENDTTIYPSCTITPGVVCTIVPGMDITVCHTSGA